MKMNILVATGAFRWDGSERRSKNYSSFSTQSSDNSVSATIPDYFDKKTLEKLSGKRVKLTAAVRENRHSEHLGDAFLFREGSEEHIKPTKPEVGEQIVIGIGMLQLAKFDWFDNPSIGLTVPESMGDKFQIDPEVFYRLSEQTVDIYIEVTDEPALPRTKLIFDTDENRVAGMGDGYVQFNQDINEPVTVAPKMTRLGKGLMMFETPDANDKNMRLIKKN